MNDHDFKLELWKNLKRFRVFDGEREVCGTYSEGEFYSRLDAKNALGPARDYSGYRAVPVVPEPWKPRLGEWTWGL